LSKKQSAKGKAVYIWERRVNDLINACKMPIKSDVKLFFDQFFYDLLYKQSMIDIFSLITDKTLAIDTKSDLFQDLWYPLTKKQPLLEEGLDFVVLTSSFIDWLGYKGRDISVKKDCFIKLQKITSHTKRYHITISSFWNIRA
jgi:hypothetical protein